jgi:prevent-host-death family protein
VVSENVGIRELRQNASEIISAAETGRAFQVTVRGKDTGVVIAKQQAPVSATEPRRGATRAQIEQSGVYTLPTPDGYERALLDIVEGGRDQAGRVGEHRQ